MDKIQMFLPGDAWFSLIHLPEIFLTGFCCDFRSDLVLSDQILEFSLGSAEPFSCP